MERQLIQWLAFAIIFGMVMGWLRRSSASPRPVAEAHILCYPRTVRVIGVVATLFFCSLVILSNVYANETSTWLTTGIFSGFAIMSLYIVLASYYERYELTDEGIIYRTVRKRRGLLAWRDVVEVGYSNWLSAFKLQSHTGKTINLSIMLMGMDVFARHALERIPFAMNEEIRTMLEALVAQYKAATQAHTVKHPLLQDVDDDM